MAFEATGSAGELRVTGRMAASLGEWSAERSRGEWSGHATVTDITPFYGMTDQYELRLFVGKRTWRWRRVDVSGEGSVQFRAHDNPEIT